MPAVGLHKTKQQHNVQKQSGRENLQCNSYIDFITLILEKQTLQQLYNEKLHSIINTRQWLFCRQRQFTLRDYFAVSYL